MKVLKFGGTSVSCANNLAQIAHIAQRPGSKFMVFSALSGSTNQLTLFADCLAQENFKATNELIEQITHHFRKFSCDLLEKHPEQLQVALEYVDLLAAWLAGCFQKPFSESLKNEIIAQGELFSSRLISLYFKSQQIEHIYLPALDFMRTDKDGEPDYFYIKQQLKQQCIGYPNNPIWVTQGFICLDAKGEIANLGRGGSDYTATIIGACLEAEEVQIWSDIDGFHNNDPRYVTPTKPLAELSFDEAAELAYFGAKILHPATVLPVKNLGIPVRLKNTMQPEAKGSLITQKTCKTGIKAIAAKDGITVIKIKSERMLLAHGFLKKVFDIFERYQTAIDMITTSEIAISLTIDNDTYLEPITHELSVFSRVQIEQEMSIICLVGNSIVNHPDTSRLFQIMQDVNLRMIAYGGSNNNISLLVNTSAKKAVLNKLNHYVFRTPKKELPELVEY